MNTNKFKRKRTVIKLQKSNWKIQIPVVIKNYIDHHILNESTLKNLSKNFLYYFINLIIYKITSNKDVEYKDSYIPLKADILKSVHYNYKVNIEFLKDIKLIEVDPHYIPGTKSKGYRINYEVLFENGLQEKDFLDYECVELSNKTIKNKIKRYMIGAEALATCGHLYKWFEEGLEIDVQKAKLKVQEKYKELSNLPEKISYIESIERFNDRQYWFRRNGRTDNRLHTNLTNMPKELRRFITYKGERLISLDVKTSQPYFTMVLIEGIREGNKKVLRILNKAVGSKQGIMIPKLQQLIDSQRFIDEFETLKEWILNNDFYLKLGQLLFPEIEEDQLDEKGNIIERNRNNQIIYRIFEKCVHQNVDKEFKSKRDLVKKVVMQILFYKTKRPEALIEFEKHFPKICEFIEIIKNHRKPHKDADVIFSRILQQLEADCILDYVTKRISQMHPNMPLWTVHDSIITTESWLFQLKELMPCLIAEYTNGIVPSLKLERW